MRNVWGFKRESERNWRMGSGMRELDRAIGAISTLVVGIGFLVVRRHALCFIIHAIMCVGMQRP